MMFLKCTYLNIYMNFFLFQDLKVKTKDGQELKCFIPAATYIGKISAHDGFSGNA